MEPKLDRSYSARSEDALGSLSRCDANLGQYEGEFKDMVLECTKNPSKDRLLDIKNALAILLGKAEKLQDTKIDAVIVGGLASGKEEARQNRKNLNARVQALVDKIRDLSNSIYKELN